jgi:hypothetical protein
MQQHPLTKEKHFLKDLALKIYTTKADVKNTGVPTIPGYCSMGPEDVERQAKLQKELAKLKYIYRHRHVAYCMVRRDIKVMKYKRYETNPNRKLNQVLVNRQRFRLLRELVQHQNKYISNLLHDVDKYKPYIALFTSQQTGKLKRLRVKDFERRDNGDLCWHAGESGTVKTEDLEYPVRDNDCVWLTKDQYDKLPHEVKHPNSTDPVEKSEGLWWYWDEVWADKRGPWFTEEEARAQLKHYCDTVLNYAGDKDCDITPHRFEYGH